MPRPYRMKARAESVEETRRRVLDAAREAILNGPTPAVTMGDVARRANVARSTLYATYGSHAGLIGAVVADAGFRAGFVRLLELINLPDAAEGIRRFLPEAARMVGADSELTRRIQLLAQLDPEVKQALAVAERAKADGMLYQAGRLAEQGRLRPGVTVEDAARLLYLLTDFGTFDALRTTWALDTDEIGHLMVAIASRHLFGEA
jgi:AcrR family transcriptional regulator